jgi:hypothetical protein
LLSSTTHSQLAGKSVDGSTAQVFACGMDTVATSVLSPDSLAYLVGAYQNRDNIHMTLEVKTSLARMGAMAVPV